MTLALGFAALALGPFVHVAGLNTYIPGPWALLRYVPVLGMARMPDTLRDRGGVGPERALRAGAGASWAGAGRGSRRAVARRGGRWPWSSSCGRRRGRCIRPRSRRSSTSCAPTRAPVRLLELPFGVRDGITSEGDFSARYQFHQTFHGKQLMGGYLSRVSSRRVQRSAADADALGVAGAERGPALPPPSRGAGGHCPGVRRASSPGLGGHPPVAHPAGVARLRGAGLGPRAGRRGRGYHPLPARRRNQAVRRPHGALSRAGRRERAVTLHQRMAGSALVSAGLRRVGRRGPDLRGGVDAAADAAISVTASRRPAPCLRRSWADWRWARRWLGRPATGCRATRRCGSTRGSRSRSRVLALLVPLALVAVDAAALEPRLCRRRRRRGLSGAASAASASSSSPCPRWRWAPRSRSSPAGTCPTPRRPLETPARCMPPTPSAPRSVR